MLRDEPWHRYRHLFTTAEERITLADPTRLSSRIESPVIVEPIVSDEKLGQLLGLQTEYPELDYKRIVDLSSTAGVVELAKDVGAMQVRGGFIVVGVDDHGIPTGEMDSVDVRPFDESRLVPMLLKYLPEPLEIRTRVADRDGHVVVLIYVGPHPSGCAVFHAIGQYQRGDETVIRFRPGDVFWRDGTRSVRITQQGFEEIVRQRILREKADWLREHQELRRDEFEQLESAYASRRVADAPLGALGLDVDTETLISGALELLRRGDTVALEHLFREAARRARVLYEQDDFETELGDVVEKLACLAATFLAYDRMDLFSRAVSALAEIYNLPLSPQTHALDYATRIEPAAKAPRLWLLVIRRVFGLGALAVRLRKWDAVRALAAQRPRELGDYYKSWLRHAQTMAARASHLYQQGPGEPVVNLLSLARLDVERLTCLRDDGIAGDDEAVLNSLAQFDILSNLAVINDAGVADTRDFYTNFAPFRTERVEPIIEMLLADADMRNIIFPGSDTDLAQALSVVARMAFQEGARYGGFWGFDRSSIEDWIRDNLPPDT
jgi:hypothetical protein